MDFFCILPRDTESIDFRQGHANEPLSITPVGQLVPSRLQFPVVEVLRIIIQVVALKIDSQTIRSDGIFNVVN